MLQEIWFKCALRSIQSPRCLKTNTNFHMPLTAICLATSIYTKGFSRSRPADAATAGLTARPLTSTVQRWIPVSVVRQVLQISQASPISLFQSLSQSISSPRISAKQKLRKRVFNKIHGLKEGAVNYKARNTHCYSCFCSVLTFYYWTWPQTIQPVRVTKYLFCLINELT